MTRKYWFIVALMFAGACGCRSALIAGWNFNSQTTGTATTTLAGEHGGTLDLSHIYSASDAVIGSATSGTSVNELSGDIVGKDFEFCSSGTGGANENGKCLIFSLSMSGYQNLVLTYATEKTGSAFTNQNWSYSIDGGANYIQFATISPPVGTSSYATATVDFSPASVLNNASSVLFELTVSGAIGATGSDHFDNIQFNADLSSVPEPAAWGAICGSGLLALCGRRLWRQRKSGKKLKS